MATDGNLVNEVREKLEYDAEVQTAVFAKNNGNEREAFTIKTDCPAAPIFYFDDLYTRFLNGISVDELAQGIIAKITDYNDEAMGMVNELLSGTWDNFKDRIEVSVVNKEWNKTKLNKVPHIEYLDLAVVFRVCLDEKDGQKASTVITYGLLNQWGVGESDLVCTALSNYIGKIQNANKKKP